MSMFPVLFDHQIRAGGYLDYLLKVNSAYQIAVWAHDENVGPVVYEKVGKGAGNGFYGDGATVAGSTFTDGRPTVLLPGTNAATNAGFYSLFNWEEYTFNVWIKMLSAGWTDGQQHNAATLLSAGNTQRIEVRKTTTNGQMVFYAGTGGVLKSIAISGQSSTAWRMYTITNSKSNDQAKAYVNGAQVGSTQTGIGADDSSAMSIHVIGDADWPGPMSYVTYWSGANNGAILSDAQILQLYNQAAPP